MANKRTGTYGDYYGSLYFESIPLTLTEMETNVIYIWNALKDKGWTDNSIAAMLGNMQAESSINPGRWQSDDIGNFSMGYGLVQWTPATKYTDWCTENGYSDPSEMDVNIARILYEVENKIQWIATSTYNISFEEFTKSTQSVAYLTRAFLLCYERPADQSESVQILRTSNAEKWYTVLTGELPFSPTTKKKKGFKFILFDRKRRIP
jgi:hypothetical protein